MSNYFSIKSLIIINPFRAKENFNAHVAMSVLPPLLKGISLPVLSQMRY